jgi:hypothetical protein
MRSLPDSAMAFQGSLSEHSLAKIFQFIQRGYRTGLLSITTANNAAGMPEDPAYIWFQSGRIMAIARDLEHTGLLSMIKKRKLVDPADIFTWHCQLESLGQPLGTQLHTAGVLDTEQLRLLFHAQVIQPVCALFKTAEGEFYFDEKSPLVQSEMTGMSITAAEAILLGLRVLRDWSLFERQLPTADKSLKKLRSELPTFKLDTQEVQVWELANGCTSISQIAQETDLPISTVQQIGLRLIMTDLVKEMEADVHGLSAVVPSAELKPPAKGPDASTGFNILTTDITGFLRRRG